MPVDRPILMRPKLVVRTIQGCKDITRRPAKDEILDLLAAGMTDDYVRDPGNVALCPYGVAGDRLWVREPFRIVSFVTNNGRMTECTVEYKAGGTAVCRDIDVPVRPKKKGWTPSIHMWRWASRLLLTLKSVRLERVHEIRADDVVREGFEVPDVDYSVPDHPDALDMERDAFARKLFAPSWDGIYSGPHAWACNPWVWRLEYEPEILVGLS